MKSQSGKLKKLIEKNKYPESKAETDLIRQFYKAYLADKNIRESYDRARNFITNSIIQKQALENEMKYDFEFNNPNIPTFFRLQRGKYTTLIKGSEKDVCDMIVEFMESNDAIRSIILTSAETYFQTHKQDFFNETVQGLS